MRHAKIHIKCILLQKNVTREYNALSFVCYVWNFGTFSKLSYDWV